MRGDQREGGESEPDWAGDSALVPHRAAKCIPSMHNLDLLAWSPDQRLLSSRSLGRSAISPDRPLSTIWTHYRMDIIGRLRYPLFLYTQPSSVDSQYHLYQSCCFLLFFCLWFWFTTRAVLHCEAHFIDATISRLRSWLPLVPPSWTPKRSRPEFTTSVQSTPTPMSSVRPMSLACKGPKGVSRLAMPR